MDMYDFDYSPTKRTFTCKACGLGFVSDAAVFPEPGTDTWETSAVRFVILDHVRSHEIEKAFLSLRERLDALSAPVPPAGSGSPDPTLEESIERLNAIIRRGR